jgi:hypothetical protein
MSGVISGSLTVWRISELKERKTARWMTTERFKITFRYALATGTDLFEQLLCGLNAIRFAQLASFILDSDKAGVASIAKRIVCIRA